MTIHGKKLTMLTRPTRLTRGEVQSHGSRLVANHTDHSGGGVGLLVVVVSKLIHLSDMPR